MASIIFSWQVDKLDLEINGVGRRWTFYIREGSKHVRTIIDEDGYVIEEPSQKETVTDTEIKDKLDTKDELFYSKLQDKS